MTCDRFGELYPGCVWFSL